MKCSWWLSGVVAEHNLQLRARRKSGAGTVEDLRLSLRARTPDFASQVLLPTASFNRSEVVVMKRIRDRVAGLDVHRDTVVACCRIVAPNGEAEVTKQSFATTRKGLGELTVFLADAGVETVAMEATGVYWKSPYYVLEGMFDELWLCNAQHVKNVPGRKSDLSDAE